MKKESTTRRSFMTGATFGTLGLVLGMNGLRRTLRAAPSKLFFPSENPLSRVVLVRNEAAVDETHNVNGKVAADMIDRAVMAFAGETDVRKAWAGFFKPGDTVGVKFTRCGWQMIHTEQAVIDHVVSRLQELGIPKERVHAADDGIPLKECTALLNLPSIKVHSLVGIAVSIKNYINFTGRASSYHGDGNVKLAESFLLPEVKGKTRLIIVDALKPYFGPGPQINPLHRWDYGGILVGTDPVAVDTTCLRICQVKRDEFKGEPWPVSPPPRFLAQAETEYKLGTADPARIRVEKLGWEKDALI